MWFWWFMFACNILIPALLAGGGWMMWKHCPAERNLILGYRTRRSMKSPETWKFAHDYCGRLWWKLGWILMIPSILVQIPFYRSDDDTIGTVGGILVTIQLILLLSTVFLTERVLKKEFGE